MRIDIISVVPELLKSPFEYSIMKRARDKNLLDVHFHDLRKYAVNKYGKVDDYPYGGGAGMVLMVECLDKCIEDLKKERSYDEVIYLTPDGKVLDQKIANTYSLKENLLLICGHYKGIDHRIREMHVTAEISIGDFVLSGGELAACVFADAIVRLIPGVIGDETSALSDSFQDGLLAPPVYTRPSEYKGRKVPDVLLSGNFPKIDKWKADEALNRTKNIRPDLLE